MHIIKLDATDSTNDYLRKMLLNNKLTTPTVVWSLFQKKGKGQRGQVWTSQAGKNLMFSLYIPNLNRSADQLISIHKIVSVCLVDWLLSLQIPNISVKWPNDILSGDKKLAGILVESIMQKSSIKSIIIGMGINVNQIQFPQLPHATSMRLRTAKTYDLEPLLLSVVPKLIEGLTHPRKDWETAYHQSLYGLNQNRRFVSGKHEFEGIIRSVTSEGKLVLETEIGEQLFDLKELQFVHVADQ
jgi:BirA family transcriptional regulator, biotin operon repressor / biotin---[acetyl-CoA-carboxylase] ligase